jgi:hypothetical protein
MLDMRFPQEPKHRSSRILPYQTVYTSNWSISQTPFSYGPQWERIQWHDFALQIIQEAVILDFQMLQQKAFFVFFGADEFHGLNKNNYDPTLTEIRYGKESSQKHNPWFWLSHRY